MRWLDDAHITLTFWIKLASDERMVHSIRISFPSCKIWTYSFGLNSLSMFSRRLGMTSQFDYTSKILGSKIVNNVRDKHHYKHTAAYS